MDWKNHLEKNPVEKVEECEKNHKEIFVQTPFSQPTFKLERKNSPRETTCFFAPLTVSV